MFVFHYCEIFNNFKESQEKKRNKLFITQIWKKTNICGIFFSKTSNLKKLYIDEEHHPAKLLFGDKTVHKNVYIGETDFQSKRGKCPQN